MSDFFFNFFLLNHYFAKTLEIQQHQEKMVVFQVKINAFFEYDMQEWDCTVYIYIAICNEVWLDAQWESC